jgi:hypothetical protein
MKQLNSSRWLTAAGLLLALPTAYVISISVLKYVFGVNGPFDAAQPVLEGWGIKDALGWNINLLILFGPFAGFLLSVFQVLKIRWHFTKQDLEVQFTIRRQWFPILVATFSISLLALLFIYMLGENCR